MNKYFLIIVLTIVYQQYTNVFQRKYLITAKAVIKQQLYAVFSLVRMSCFHYEIVCWKRSRYYMSENKRPLMN